MEKVMTAADFDVILERRIASMRSVLASKAGEYAAEGDRLHNFNVAARVAGMTPEKALWGMAMKHLVSVIDLVEKPETASEERVNEKVGDLINYLVLLEAVFAEGRK